MPAFAQKLTSNRNRRKSLVRQRRMTLFGRAHEVYLRAQFILPQGVAKMSGARGWMERISSGRFRATSAHQLR